MGRRVLRRHIWGYSVCLCPIKRTSGLYGLYGLDEIDPCHEQVTETVKMSLLMRSTGSKLYI